MSQHKKKIVFIINPVSGIGRQKKTEKSIIKYLDHDAYTYEIAYTKYAHHAGEIAKEYANKGFEAVVAIGGDGSANDVAQGLVNSETIMGILPAGSGNGLAHHLKIPLSHRRAIQIINRLKISRIDTATLNNKLFISIAGLGFDALVAEEFGKCSKRGFFSYFRIILKQFSKYKSPVYTVSFDGKRIERKAIIFSFANSDQFGFKASIAPTASINDGFIDLCIVKPISLLRAIPMALKLFRKKIDTSKKVELYKVREARVEISESIPCHIDGDPSERVSSAVIKINPASLNFIVP